LKKAFEKCDWDRYAVAERLVGSGKRVLDISCRDGHMLLKFKDKYQELYGIDIYPLLISRKQKKRQKKFSLKIFRNLILLKEMQIILFFFQIIILILLFV
jgi:ubiquinone/menaquinone biosynthesis C-methylase UbiE